MSRRYIVNQVQHHGTYVVVTLQPRQAQDALRFWPGQYAALSVKHDGRWSATRCLSFTTMPRSDGFLEFAFRVTGNFTEALASAQPGNIIKVQGPFGEFTAPEYVRHIVMVAGGIGITPFMSIMRTATALGSQQQLSLVYVCKNAQTAPFRQEIKSLMAQNPNLQVLFVASDVQDPDALHSPGPLQPKHFKAVLANMPDDTIFMLCGPEGLNKSAALYAQQVGVHPEDILTESFAAKQTSSWLLGLKTSTLTYVSSAIAVLALTVGIGLRNTQATSKTASVPTKATMSTASSTDSDDDTSSAITTTPAASATNSSTYSAPQSGVS